MPSSLQEALRKLKRDSVLRDALGEHIFEHFLLNRQREWDNYIQVIHGWELDRYLDMY